MKVQQPKEKVTSLKTLILQLQLSLELSQLQELLSAYSDFLLFFAEYSFLFETSPTGTSLSKSTSTPSDTSFSSQDPARDGGNWYGYCGCNPLTFIDPTGCDDLYYDESGNYLKTEISNTTNVYLSSNGTDTLFGNQTDFNTMTAALYGEGTDNLDEMQAIGDVIMNRAEFMGTSAGTEIAADGQVNGYNAASRKAVADGQTSNENSKLNTARNAAITTILGTCRGKSNGAYYWDGADITYNSHRNWGIHYTDSSHDIYGTGDTTGGPYQNYNRDANNNPTTLRGITDHILDSTAAYGGTIFWKKSDEYRRIMQERAFTR